MNSKISITNSVYVSIETDNPLFLFLQTSESYGRAFYELTTLFKSLKSHIVKLTMFDMKLILNKAKDQSDNFAVAVLTLDFTLKQCINLVIDADTEEFCLVLSNFVCVSFNLDKNNSTLLMN